MARTHHRLLAWQEAMALAEEIYAVTRRFPRDEIYGITAQLRRAAVSVTANIAEGAGRESDREFLQFLYIARGSLCEVETLMMLCRNTGYCTEQDGMEERISQIFARLGGLINSIRNRTSR